MIAPVSSSTSAWNSAARCLPCCHAIAIAPIAAPAPNAIGPSVPSPPAAEIRPRSPPPAPAAFAPKPSTAAPALRSPDDTPASCGPADDAVVAKLNKPDAALPNTSNLPSTALTPTAPTMTDCIGPGRASKAPARTPIPSASSPTTGCTVVMIPSTAPNRGRTASNAGANVSPTASPRDCAVSCRRRIVAAGPVSNTLNASDTTPVAAAWRSNSSENFAAPVPARIWTACTASVEPRSFCSSVADPPAAAFTASTANWSPSDLMAASAVA